MIKNLFILSVPIIVSVFTGCSSQIRSGQLPSTLVEPKIIEGKIFIPNQYSISNVGDVMFTAYEYAKDSTKLEYDSFIVEKDVDLIVKHKAKTFLFKIESGDYLLKYSSEIGDFYQKRNGVFRGSKPGYGGLFVPKGSTEAQEIYWSWKPGHPKNIYLVTLSPPIQGHTSKTLISENDSIKSKIKATITYAGISQDQVRFVYNQFTDTGLIKPAFTQSVSFDYKPNSIYGYKSARFKVKKADATHIEYEVIEPLDN